jgi:hypothetical protein
MTMGVAVGILILILIYTLIFIINVIRRNSTSAFISGTDKKNFKVFKNGKILR